MSVGVDSHIKYEGCKEKLGSRGDGGMAGRDSLSFVSLCSHVFVQ